MVLLLEDSSFRHWIWKSSIIGCIVSYDFKLYFFL